MGASDFGSNIEAQAEPLQTRLDGSARERLKQPIHSRGRNTMSFIGHGELKAISAGRSLYRYWRVARSMCKSIGEKIREELADTAPVAAYGPSYVQVGFYDTARMAGA